ncbi:VOC family protein [Streptomyces sp. NPDC049954]|uniref:VOC family protein n=1 Tax=Streptomyces sp. NPDC049954 TaxID=3155779 RepID=UPI00342874D1
MTSPQADSQDRPPQAVAPVHWKVVIDASDPLAQAEFWAAALGYLVEDHSVLIGGLLAAGALPEEQTVQVRGHHAFRDVAAVRHPEDPVQDGTGTGLGRRLLFLRVPEPKQGKNRLHLDLHPGPEAREAEVVRLTELGATFVRRVEEPQGTHVVMRDPEGNELCVA